MPNSDPHVPFSAGGFQLAITGMDISLAGCEGLGAFERLTINGSPLADGQPFQPTNFTPAEVDFWRLTTEQINGFNQEDRLLLKLSARLLQTDQRGGPERSAFLFARGGVLAASVAERFGMPFRCAEPQSGASGLFQNLPAQVRDLSLEGNFLAAGLRQAQELLAEGSCDQVILAAASLVQDIQTLLAPAGIKTNAGARTLGFDRSVDGWTFGSGAAALSLMAAERAAALGKRIYASIAGIGYAARAVSAPKKHLVPTFVSSDTIFASAQSALQLAGSDSDAVGYIETLASGFPPLDAAEIGGLARAYQTQTAPFSCALGSLQTSSGYMPTASPLAALIRTALCLYDRVIPATQSWSGPKKPELWQQTPFYIPQDQRAWFKTASAPVRKAALNAIGWDGSSLHLILAEPPQGSPRANQVIANSPFQLFPLAGSSQAEILNALTTLRDSLDSIGLNDAARAAYQNYIRVENPTYAAAIVGQDINELRREIDFGLRDIPGAFEKGRTWQTPLGSSFSPAPVGQDGSVAFVYPGAFNSYLGLGRDLLQLYPQIYEPAVTLSADLGKTIQERLLFPRSLEAFSKEQLQELETQLNADPIAMITSGSLISVLFTMILRDVFKIQAATAFGYSLGEIGMLFASGIWEQADDVSARLQQSALFHKNIAGPQNAVRRHWGLPPLEQASEPIWANYFLMTTAENAIRAVENEENVYLTHINTPRQVVIGGNPQACQRVITVLKCTSLRAPFDFALHCQAMASEYTELSHLLNWPVAHTPTTRLYTAAGCAPLPVERQAVAENISRMLCERIDFPGLVRQVYASGARVFIELGANANCSKWVEDILKTDPAVSVAINRKGVDDHTSIVRLLAKLVSQRVPLDLSPLYA